MLKNTLKAVIIVFVVNKTMCYLSLFTIEK